MRCLALVALAACVPARATPMTWPTLDSQLLADAAATYNFRLGLPNPVAVTADGAVLFTRTPARAFTADLYELDTRTGAVRTLAATHELLGTGEEHLSAEEKARRERTRTATRGIVQVDVSADGQTVLVPLGGRFFLIDRTTGARRAIDPHGAAYDPHLSPDGMQIAFVRDDDVWVIAAAGGEPRRLTHHEPGFQIGVAEFAAQEELDRRRGFWWSPDSQQLLVQKSDLRPVDTIYVSDARHPETPPVPFKYPRAGRPNAEVSLQWVDVSAGPQLHDRFYLLAPDAYLARVQWPEDGPPTAVTLSRAQDRETLIVLEGARTLVDDHAGDLHWLDVPRPGALGYVAGNPLWLADGSGFLWTDQHHGAWTLQLRAPDGQLVRELTTPGFGLRKLVGLDGGDAIVEASADPTRCDVYRVPLAGGAPVPVTHGEGVASASYAHGVLVITTALAAGGKRTVAIARSGSAGPRSAPAGSAESSLAQGRTFELPSVAEQPPLVPTTVLETVELAGRTYHVAITRPRAFDPHRRYPVLLKVYAGPHVQTVEAARDNYVMDQWYADAGFIVVRSDGRGTPNRGTAWERAIWKDLITVPMEDQIGALQAIAARHHELDLARVGVFGWSFGGYFSAMAVLLRPDVFRCAVAGAPVTDWQLYDTAYTERYMQTPAQNPGGYARTSALTHASKLDRPLLLVHGITDDNVHFAHTLALIEGLYAAGKYADVITLSATHMVPDPRLNLAREEVQIRFFRDHLGPPS